MFGVKKRTPKLLTAMGLALSFVMAITPVFADAGLPMVAVFLPPMWLALVPIIIIEAMVCVKVTRASSRQALVGLGIGNIASTIVGIPIMWVFLASIELACCGGARGLSSFWTKLYAVTVQAPWLIPYEHAFNWMVPAAIGILLLPSFLLSVAVEGLVARPFLRDVPSKLFWRSITVANIASYLALAVIFAIGSAMGALRRLDPF